MNIFTSIRAWCSGLFTKGKTMTDTIDPSTDTAALAAAVDPSIQAAQIAAVIEQPLPLVPATPVVETPAPDAIEKLEAILAALGHKLPVFWDEAVALAKKAL